MARSLRTDGSESLGLLGPATAFSSIMEFRIEYVVVKLEVLVKPAFVG